MARLSKNDISRFSISFEEVNKLNISKDDLKGLTEIIPNKKYRIVISNGMKRDGSRDRISETIEGSLLDAVERKKQIKKDLDQNVITADARSKFEQFAKLYISFVVFLMFVVKDANIGVFSRIKLPIEEL